LQNISPCVREAPYVSAEGMVKRIILLDAKEVYRTLFTMCLMTIAHDTRRVLLSHAKQNRNIPGTGTVWICACTAMVLLEFVHRATSYKMRLARFPNRYWSDYSTIDGSCTLEIPVQVGHVIEEMIGTVDTNIDGQRVRYFPKLAKRMKEYKVGENVDDLQYDHLGAHLEG